MEKETQFEVPESGGLLYDPIVIVRDVLKRWMWILLAALVVTVGSYILMDLSYQPQYRTRTTFVVTNRGSSNTVYSNLSSASNVAVVFEDLLNSSLMRQSILEHIGESYFDGSITASVVPETNLLTVTVTASDPRTAFLVAQAVIDHHEDVTYQVVDNVIMEVLQYPAVPTAAVGSPISISQLREILLVAAAVAAAVFAGLSFLRDTVRSSREAKVKLDCSCLGEIPHEQKYKTIWSRIRRRKASILITSPMTGFGFTEAVRKLRRRVEKYMGDGKVLMVTSLMENEGKSTVAVNLALSLAGKRKKVLLIDCDLRKPACHKLMGQMDLRSGLREVLSGKERFSDVVLRDKLSGLHMLLEKRGGRDSGDLLSSEAMAELIRRSREKYDYIVLDLPPMSEVSDSECAMGYADASLLVVRQNVAAAPVLNRAIAMLSRGDAKLLGCVLNNVYSSSFSSGYGYGYGYGYGKYGKYGQYGKYGHYGTQE